VYSQYEPGSSSIIQSTESQGSPLLLVSVAIRPFFNRLSPPSEATQSVPS
jgi:hypothetical protein